MKSALRRPPTHQHASTMLRAKTLVLDTERALILEEASKLRRALDGARVLLIAGADLDAETAGRMLAHCAAFVDDVRLHLTRRR